MRINPFTGMALLCLLCPTGLTAQPDKYKTTKLEYIAQYRDEAVSDMIKTGVPASITLAQGVLESEFGNSFLAREANNHFGIKCHSDWNGQKVYKDDDHRNECFRKYPSVAASFEDHSRFLRNRDRYAFLFDLRITDYKGWARGLKKAGYATNPHYANRLIAIIEEFELHKLDRMGTAMPIEDKKSQPSLAKQEKLPLPEQVKASYRMTGNQVPFITSSEGDTYYSLAAKNNMEIWQILKYNDADKYESPAPGSKIYLKPKRNKGIQPSHTVKEGETMRDISQMHAVKLKKLYKYNKMKCCAEPATGQVLRLR